MSKVLPKWRTDKFVTTTEDPKTGAKFTWCLHHGNKSKGGAQPGMYMPSEHDHTQWDFDKNTKADAQRASVKSKRYVAKRKTSNGEDYGTPSAPKKVKDGSLSFAKSFKAALQNQ